MKDAPVGFTDLETSAVGVNVCQHHRAAAGVFRYRLEAVDDDEETPTPRTADVVFEPFVTEWHYRIRPPAGFQPRELPANDVLDLGPARLISEFNVNADGAVHASWPSTRSRAVTPRPRPTR